MLYTQTHLQNLAPRRERATRRKMIDWADAQQNVVAWVRAGGERRRNARGSKSKRLWACSAFKSSHFLVILYALHIGAGESRVICLQCLWQHQDECACILRHTNTQYIKFKHAMYDIVWDTLAGQTTPILTIYLRDDLSLSHPRWRRCVQWGRKKNTEL
jgi:hypothetical protein